MGDYKGIPMLFAEREGEAALALACSVNVLTVVSLGIAVATRGRHSVHDYAAGTLVRSATADRAAK